MPTFSTRCASSSTRIFLLPSKRFQLAVVISYSLDSQKI